MRVFVFLAVIFIVVSAVGFVFAEKETVLEPIKTTNESSVSSILAAHLVPLIESPSPTPPSVSLHTPSSAKTLTGGTQTFQTFNNCGPASLSMALSYYDITVSQQELGRDIRPFQNPQGNNDDKSVTLIELGKRAEKDGFLTYYRPGGDTEMMKKFITYDIPVITRTWLKLGEDIGHYRVVKGYNESTQTFIQDDSLQGKNLSYSYDDFNELWEAFNYEFLVLVPPEKKEIAEAILGKRVDEKVAWEQAEQTARNQLASDPQNIYVQFNLSVALYHLGKYEESVEVYEKVASKLPSRMLWYQIEPILAYYSLENFDTVLAMTQSIISNQNRANSELHFLRGLIFQKNNQPTQAQQAFDLAETYNTTEYWKYNIGDLQDV